MRLLLPALFAASALCADIGFDETANPVSSVGLVNDRAIFEGAEVENFLFSNGKKYIYVKPDEAFSATFSYHLKSPCSEALHFHYFLVGLYEPDATVCETNTPGVCDAQGTATIWLRAPKISGTYQVRFCESRSWTIEEVRSPFWEPSEPAATVMGVVVVQGAFSD